MYVCICKAVTDRELDAALARGASTVEAVMEATGACTGCGSCRNAVSARVRNGARGASQPVATVGHHSEATAG